MVAIVAPDNVMVDGAVNVTVPPQAEAEELGTVSPAGRTSVKATPVSGTVFAAGLVIVKLSEVVAFTAIVVGVNALAIDGGATTIMLAVAVPPFPPSFDVTWLVVLI